eukprot:scaffold192226_cov23-Tisochrysis_lutea.AAC.1
MQQEKGRRRGVKEPACGGGWHQQMQLRLSHPPLRCLRHAVLFLLAQQRYPRGVGYPHSCAGVVVDPVQPHP